MVLGVSSDEVIYLISVSIMESFSIPAFFIGFTCANDKRGRSTEPISEMILIFIEQVYAQLTAKTAQYCQSVEFGAPPLAGFGEANYSINPLPVLTTAFCSFNSFTMASRMPLIKVLLLGELNSLDISMYSFRVTFTGMPGKFITSVMAIFISNISIDAIRSGSQLAIFLPINDIFLVSSNMVL